MLPQGIPTRVRKTLILASQPVDRRRRCASPGHEVEFFPGETNFRSADVIVISKALNAAPSALDKIRDNSARLNPGAEVILSDLQIDIEGEATIEARRVLVVEDGPTLTHGGMSFGAGTLAANRFGAAEIIDPRPHATGSITNAISGVSSPRAGATGARLLRDATGRSGGNNSSLRPGCRHRRQPSSAGSVLIDWRADRSRRLQVPANRGPPVIRSRGRDMQELRSMSRLQPQAHQYFSKWTLPMLCGLSTWKPRRTSTSTMPGGSG